MGKKKKSGRQESPENAAKRLKEQNFASINAEARREMVQRRILAAEEMAANRTKLRFLASRVITTGPEDTFDQFPVEIRQQILKELTDINSLHSLISAYRSVQNCYVHGQYQCEVFCQTLVDEMSLPIFLQAAAIFSISVRRTLWTGKWNEAFQNVHQFMNQYSEHSRATTFNKRSYSMKILISIAKFHLTIKAVTQDFFESCLSLHPWTHVRYEKKELKRLEELRIQRAFYNLELYVRIFQRGHDYLSKQTLSNRRLHGTVYQNVTQATYQSFFGHFSYWEIEEMVSVKDYMEREYNDILNECRGLLATHSQAHLYGSPSTLKSIHQAGNIISGSYDEFTRHYNHFTRIFINMGIGFYWKVCNQDGPKTKLPLIDIPIQQENVRLYSQFHKMMIVDHYMSDQLMINRRSQIPTPEYLRFLNCFSRIPANRAGQLNLPSSFFAWSYIKLFVTSKLHYYRDFWSSWGYCMWDAERLEHILDIFWPPLNTPHELGPRSRLSSRIVL